MYAVAIYTYARSGELEALTDADVDVEHGAIHVSKAVNRKTGKLGTPKSDEIRDIPVEPALAPLFELLKRERPNARLLRMPPDEDRAELLRADLHKAGVTRAALFTDDRLHKQLTFHDLKATGTTWAAVRGDDPIVIMKRAAHRDFKTTLGYIREAENHKAGFGTPFPPLPNCLLESASGQSATPPDSEDLGSTSEDPPGAETRENTGELCEAVGFKSRWGRNITDPHAYVSPNVRVRGRFKGKHLACHSSSLYLESGAFR